MQTIKQAATEFLSHHRIAVTGVARHAEGHGANVVYQRLRERGYEVYAWTVNESDDIDLCRRLGVTGIISDRPGYVRERLG